MTNGCYGQRQNVPETQRETQETQTEYPRQLDSQTLQLGPDLFADMETGKLYDFKGNPQRVRREGIIYRTLESFLNFLCAD